MNTVKKVELIRTTLSRRGTGKDETSPIRIITEYWTPEGEKVAESDPAMISITPELRVAIRENLTLRIGDGWMRAYDAVLEVLQND